MSFHTSQYCPVCDNKHYGFTPEEKESILNALLDGEAQIATPQGIKLKQCILEWTDYHNAEFDRRSTAARRAYEARKLLESGRATLNYYSNNLLR